LKNCCFANVCGEKCAVHRVLTTFDEVSAFATCWWYAMYFDQA